MPDLHKSAETAYEVPLHELLEGVPENARLVIDSEDGMSTSFIPVGLYCKRAAQALRQALARSEQESVGACVTCGAPKSEWLVDTVNTSQERVEETAKGEHEPFIYVREDNERPFGGYEHCSEADAGAFPVYTAPPRREWVGLTDEEIYDYADKFLYQHGSNYGIRSFGKAVEAKLKEKNGA